MIITIAYSLIVLLATTLGASAGIGGGIIIKPMFDFIAIHSVADISFLSANAVFFMTLYSSAKRFVKNQDIDIKLIVLIALSSIVGGYIGNYIFSFILQKYNADLVSLIQSLCLCFVVLFLIIYFSFKNKIIQFHIKNNLFIFVLSANLGFISAFLSIGGGPLNVALYSMVLGLTLKESVTYSLATIFFAQGTQILDFAINDGYSNYPYQYLFAIVPIAILGGILGQKIYKKSSEKGIQITLVLTMLFVLFINLFNLYSAFGRLYGI